MSDIIDDAQTREAQYRAACLANARPPAPTGPQERDAEGRVICAECGELIPPARLARVPNATRCARCQDEADGERPKGC